MGALSFQEAVRQKKKDGMILAGSDKRDTDTQTAVICPRAHADFGIQGRGEGLDDGQPQPAAHATLVAAQSIKSRENLVPLGRGDSRAVIFDVNDVPALVVEEPDDDTSAGVVVADGVVDEV